MKVQGYVVCIVVCLDISPRSAYAFQCISCQGIDDPYNCNRTISCTGSQEFCFLHVQGGKYSMGCADNQYCGGIPSPDIIGRSVKNRQVSNNDVLSAGNSQECLECCSSDSCNSNLCNHLKLDGNWAEWSAWSVCDVQCGKGVHSRTRTCTNPSPAYGGLHCPGNATETRDCVASSLCPVMSCTRNLKYNSSFTNVALRKAVTLSSVLSPNTGPASLMVDGSQKSSYPCAHTNTQLHPNAVIDLGKTYPLYSMYIVNRLDCCSKYIRGSDEPSFQPDDPVKSSDRNVNKEGTLVPEGMIRQAVP